jgi:aspartate kinase
VPGRHGFDQRGEVSLTVDSNEQAAGDLPPTWASLADVKYEGKKALICMVGEDIRGQSGIAAQVFNAIRHINVRMISQGASEINMSFMIEEDDADEAVRSLHAAFFKDPDPDLRSRKRFDVEQMFGTRFFQWASILGELSTRCNF